MDRLSKGWHREPGRHSLASRGIRTRAIPNPVAGLNIYDPEIYERNLRKDSMSRQFKGSGLEHIDKDDLLEKINESLHDFDGSKEWDEGRLEDYYHKVRDMFREFDMSFEEFENIYESGKKLFNIRAIYIYGSRVTGYWLPYSDVDVYIQIGPTPGIKNHHLDQMATEMNNMVVRIKDEEGRSIHVDISMISVFSPDINFDMYDFPAILIWEAS